MRRSLHHESARPVIAAALALCAAIRPLPAQDSAAPADPPGRPRYELYFSPEFGAESGIRLVSAAVTGIAVAEQSLFTRAGAPGEDRSAGTFIIRGLRTVTWDLPVAWWFGVMLHETFGHGGRAREFNASPGVHLGSPWQGRSSFTSFDARGRSAEELLYIYIGGAEANGLAATLLERRVVEGARLRPFEMLNLASNRLVVSDYVLRTTPDPASDPQGFFAEYSGGGDVANYLGYLHTLHGGTGAAITPAIVDPSVRRQYRRLRRQALWNALDPGLWWALGSAFIADDGGGGALPLPRTRRHRFLPILSSEWTPSGGQTSIEVVMAPLVSGARRTSWFSFVARRGRGPSGAFGALGAAAEDLLIAGPFSLGGMAEIWHDPRGGAGGGARLRARLARGALRGLYFDFGVKSQGYFPGQPSTPGVHAAFGLVFPL
jgi:hypothetical protein